MRFANAPGRCDRVMPPFDSTPAGKSSARIPARCLVLIPALNEQEAVGATVTDWRALGFSRVRVVDNGSSDSTAAKARDAGAEVIGEARRGYGQAAWTGLQEIPDGIEWVLFSSADGSDLLTRDELSDWNSAAAVSDLIVGDRCASPDSRAAMNASQRVCTALFQGVARLGWGGAVRDVGSLRAIRLEALPQLALADRGFGWNVEMQIRALECRLRVVELPVRFRPRRAGQSKISGTILGTTRAALGILTILFRLWWTRGRRVIPDPS